MNHIDNHHIAAALDELIREAQSKAATHSEYKRELRSLRRVLTRAAAIANPVLVDPTAWDVV